MTILPRLGMTFIIGIILARLLTPREFGLIGMITIFIAVSQSFIDSGFTQALIRKKDCTQTDYSTVFYFNLSVGFFLYIVLFFSAEAISRFFDEPQLKLARPSFRPWTNYQFFNHCTNSNINKTN